MLSPETWVVLQLADRAGATVCRRVIRQFQARGSDETRDHLPHVRTAWDAICIQVQGEESICWDAYLAQVEIDMLHEVQRLPALERAALWLQTNEGSSWESDEERETVDPPVQDSDIVEYLQPTLLGLAADWSNPALRAQLLADGRR